MGELIGEPGGELVYPLSSGPSKRNNIVTSLNNHVYKLSSGPSKEKKTFKCSKAKSIGSDKDKGSRE